MRKIVFDDPYKRKCAIDIDELYIQSNHMLFLQNIMNQTDFSYNDFITQQLKIKHSSYKSQDKKKKRYDEEQHITYEGLLQKLLDSKLKCYYCSKDINLVYRNKNEKDQWSLERFNNNVGHYSSNTCISCLRCNLQRRNDNHEYFKQSKQMTIFKRVN